MPGIWRGGTMTMLPSRFRLKCIQLKDMPIGEFIYYIPWSMFPDDQGKLWVDGSRWIEERHRGPIGTYEMKMTRMKDGFVIDTSHVDTGHLQWMIAKKPDDNSIPVVSIK